MNSAPEKAKARKPGKPKPGVEVGDSVYFKSGDQHTHGVVRSHGAHGCHIDHSEGRAKVYWEDILGHRSRSAKSARVLDKGDDGFLMEDDHGRRRFVAGDPPEPKREDTPGDHDAVLEHARKATPLAKALGQLDELVKAHVSAYTRKDGTFVAAHDDKRVKRAPGAAPGQRSLLDQQAKKPHVTETPAFKKWFGDSRVVDASGKPLVVYHGTKSDIPVFKDSLTTDGGFHFGTLDQANMRVSGSGKNLMPVYLSASSLQRSKDMGGNWKTKIKAAKAAGKGGIIYLNRYEGLSSEVIRRLSDNGLLNKIDRMSDAEFRRAVPEARDSYIVFDPAQIKSAIGNRGTFEPGNHDMTKSIQSAGDTEAPRVLFFKGGPLANRPGLAQKKITDRTGHQTTRWVRTAHDAPALQPGHRVKFQAGEHRGEGEVTAVGEHGVTARDAAGREHQIHHHEITHFKPGEASAAPASAPEKNADDSNVVPMTGPRSSEEIARALFDTSEIEKLPAKVSQPVDNWADLLKKGEEGLGQYKEMLGKVADALQLVTGKRPESLDVAQENENAKAKEEKRDPEKLAENDYMLPEHWDDQHGYLFMGPLKGEKRAKEKVNADYKGDWSQVKDMVRATIAVPSVTQLPKVLAELKKAGVEMAQKPKNNLVRPLPGGYRDINMIVRLPNGLLAELQLHVKPMTLAKEKGHHHYETSRGITAKYAEHGIDEKDKWSEDDRASHAAAMSEQEKLYGAAWDKASGGGSSEKKDEPNLTKSLSEPMILLWRKGKGEVNG